MCERITCPGRRRLALPHLLLWVFGLCLLSGGSSGAVPNVPAWLDETPARLYDWLSNTANSVESLLDPPVPEPKVAPEDPLVVFSLTQHGPFDDLILSAAREWNIDPFLFKGLLANESKLDPVRYGKRRYGKRGGRTIVISGGAIGIAQFTGGGIRAVNLLRRRRERAGDKVLFFDHDRALEPHEAIPAAAELLAHLLQRYGRDGGVTAYNSGVVGGVAVARYGFWRARHDGKLNRVGVILIQGERFLLNVLKRANSFRQDAGLSDLPGPDANRPDSRRYAGLPPRRLTAEARSDVLF